MSRKLFWVRYFSLPVLFLGSCVLFPESSSAQITASRSIPVDTTWRAIGPVGDLTGQGINNVGLAWEASHGGWNSNISFDDSDAAGWTNAIAVVHPTPPLLRYWVDGTDTVGSSPAYFRKVFNIPGVPLNGSLDFIVDDDAKIFVNGQLVFSDSNSLATFLDNLNVTPYLQSGLNLIAVKAQDQQGAQSINGQLDISYQISEPSLIGDYNRDSIVDMRDYIIWRMEVGHTVERCSGADANCNGFVEDSEYDPWRESYGNTDDNGLVSSATVHTSAIPEPGVCCLAGFAFSAGLMVLRKRQPSRRSRLLTACV